MAVIVCHSPRGGTGTTFLSAQIAMGLADKGADVTVITTDAMDSLPLHFGLPPTQPLPRLEAPADEAVVAQGIDLRNHADAPFDADFVPMLNEVGLLDPAAGRVLILDVPCADRVLAQRLLPFADLHICPLKASPDSLATLPQVYEDQATRGLERTCFVINALDETRRLARHSAAFLRELAGESLIGKVRQDEAVPEALAMLQPLSRYAPSSAALSDMRALVETIAPRLASTARAPEASATETNQQAPAAPAASNAA